MAKKDFTQIEGRTYSNAGDFIAAASENISNTENVENTTKTKTTKRKKYERLDVTKPAPEEYRFTARMPGEYGVYLNQKAWRNHSTVTKVIQELVAADMATEEGQEILKELDALNQG